MGICGTAMGSLAGIFQSLGFRVTGSDRNIYPPMSTQLEELGISIMSDYKAKNLEPAPDFVIVGNVISKHFEEADALLKSEIPYTSLPKAIGDFVIGDKQSYVVAGTHGKTTTTSILTWVEEAQGMRPGFLIGGIPLNFEKSFRAPKDDHFVIEGDEYDTAFFDKVPKFIHYRPKHVIFTSLEFDHADIYDSLDDIRKAFKELIRLIPDSGTLVYNSDDPEVSKIAKMAKCLKIGYGIEGGDYQAVDRSVAVGRNQFNVQFKGKKIADIAVKHFGEHNTLNVLGVFALSETLGWDSRKTLQALSDFKGVKRRQEVLTTSQGIQVIEDFAHHPTAVRLTIGGVQEQKNGEGRVIAVFEPRSATARRKIFQSDFMNSLSMADLVALPQPFNQASIPEDQRFSSEEVIKDLQGKGIESFLGESIDDIVTWLTQVAKPSDTILIMSNGGFDGIYQKLLERL